MLQPFLTSAVERFRHLEQDWVSAHFEWVLEVLRAQSVDGFDAQRLAARERTLELLAGYKDRGLFPRNPLHDRIVPTFVDDVGTACAVAHLMMHTGAAEMAERIQRASNLAYVRDMHDDELAEWAAEAGISLDEASFIQPDYCPSSETEDECTWYEQVQCTPVPIGCPCIEHVEPDGEPCTPEGALEDLCLVGTCRTRRRRRERLLSHSSRTRARLARSAICRRVHGDDRATTAQRFMKSGADD